MNENCPYCREFDADAATAIAALAAAIDADDLDAAIELGLLRFEPGNKMPCDRCRPAIGRLIVARDARLAALAARDRYRRRNARLEQRAQTRAAKRLANAPIAGTASPALPAAAAAALARAKAKAAAPK